MRDLPRRRRTRLRAGRSRHRPQRWRQAGATCLDCHGSPHELLPASDPKSRVHHTNIPATCGSCHSQKFVMEDGGQSAQMVASYEQSVHGHAVAAGSEKAAVCTDCHGTHEILDAKDSKSPIFKFNVPSTCGQCHQDIAKQFKASIHGQSIAQGNWQAPVCTDCHGIHSIKSHLDPNSPVNAQNVAQVTCARCHEGVRLSQEFGVPGRRAIHLSGQLSRFGVPARIASRRQLC